eukprot:GDKI01041354.1.p1 GENE.GDKI01041354.1~~GDKI01041354.1.p1  ORF type:complete len:104 (-),score=21.09 GDKI01041354.1:4-315(-)
MVYQPPPNISVAAKELDEKLNEQWKDITRNVVCFAKTHTVPASRTDTVTHTTHTLAGDSNTTVTPSTSGRTFSVPHMCQNAQSASSSSGVGGGEREGRIPSGC